MKVLRLKVTETKAVKEKVLKMEMSLVKSARYENTLDLNNLFLVI